MRGRTGIGDEPGTAQPGGDRRSHVVLRGKPWGELDSRNWSAGREVLASSAHDALAELRARFDVVVCEGAGSPAEVNLREGDYVNMGLARAADLPVVLVGDIDRGGVLAAMAGTVGLLDKQDQARLAAFVVNKFRGDRALLEPGLRTLREITGRPVLGVLPWLFDVWLDSEDALAIAGWSRHRSGGQPTLRVAVVRLPRVSNATDVDPLAAEPGVAVTVTADPDVLAAADLAVLPGTRSTVDDLSWLRERGLADVLAVRVRQGRPVLGICGGFQMFAGAVHDDVESGAGTVPGLDLLPLEVRFGRDKTLRRPTGHWRGHPVTGYEIHHGVITRSDGDWEPFLDGMRRGALWATMWHGAFESDAFRRAWLAEIASQAGVPWQPHENAPGFATRREAMLDTLADAIAEHVDTSALLELIREGAPADLPWVRLGREPG